MAEKPEDQKNVPYERFQEVNDDKKAALDDKILAQQQAKFWQDRAEKTTQQVQEAPKLVTKAEIQAKITAKEMTTEEGQAILDDQWKEGIKREAKEEALLAVRKETVETRQVTKFGDYEKSHPEAFKIGTDQNKKLKAKFDELVGDGLPSTKATELVALEIVLGTSKTPKPSETTSFSGGVGDANLYAEEPGASPDGMPADLNKSLTPRLKAHYKGLVDRGEYTWDDVEKEAKYINPEQAKKYDLLSGKPGRR